MDGFVVDFVCGYYLKDFRWVYHGRYGLYSESELIYFLQSGLVNASHYQPPAACSHNSEVENTVSYP